MQKGFEPIVRTAAGAGRWFPGTRKALKAMADDFIENARVDKVDGRIVGAVAPHAGYVYSGKTAGYTFRAIRDNAETWGRPDTVVVLGIRHRGGFSGVALMDGDVLRTPLGDAVLDTEGGEAMAAESPRIYFDYRPHVGEHSAENEIPFVQSILPQAKVIVGLIGDHDPRTIDDLVTALDRLSKMKKIVVIASSDMLHDPDYDLVRRTDTDTLKMVKTMDHAGIEKGWSYSRQTLCGIGPVLAVMRFAERMGCRKGTVLHYRNSGDDFPESRGRWVVGYGSVVFAAPK
ncbi:MAG: AmmeMemoRadiSam system protein B [Deltaproteobacteria bacterium]|nr:AmmeMemoRadiSam system protein B [Deltaproteobacteria bacterium]